MVVVVKVAQTALLSSQSPLHLVVLDSFSIRERASRRKTSKSLKWTQKCTCFEIIVFGINSQIGVREQQQWQWQQLSQIEFKHERVLPFSMVETKINLVRE